MARPRIAIIGAGRMGRGLGLALQRRGYSAALFARSERPVAASLLLQTGDISAVTNGAEVVIIATPDDAVTAVARQLAEAGSGHAGTGGAPHLGFAGSSGPGAAQSDQSRIGLHASAADAGRSGHRG